MEVDVEFDLAQKLSSMGTNDREDLLKHFQSIVGNQMSPACCGFYLEMANWNLQTALCTYYDVTSSPMNLPKFTIIEESNHIELDSVGPKQSFVKHWLLKNSGKEPWPNNLKLKFIQGEKMSEAEQIVVPAIAPSESTVVSVTMCAPMESGIYHQQWRMVTLQGSYCGDSLVFPVNIETPNINLITQQMSTLGQSHSPATLSLFTINNYRANMFPLDEINLSPMDEARLADDTSRIGDDDCDVT